MRYLPEVLAMFSRLFPIGSTVFPLAYLIYDISDNMVSMLFLLLCMPLNMVYGIFCWVLLSFPVVSVCLSCVLCGTSYLFYTISCGVHNIFQLHLLVLYLRLHMFLPTLYASSAFTCGHQKKNIPNI